MFMGIRLKIAASALLLSAATTLPLAAQVETPAAGSPLRTAILDAVRPMVEAEVGGTVEFVVYDLRVLGEWAFVNLHPQRKGGGAIVWTYTRYQAQHDADAFDENVTALLRDTPAGWLVYQYDLGATDASWVGWKDLYPAPPEVFPDGG